MANPTMQVRLVRISYPKVFQGATNQDLNCSTWSGLIDFAVVPNGSYAAVGIPFGPAFVPWGTLLPMETLVYDGIGGTCGGNGKATLSFRITAEGTGPDNGQAIGSTFNNSNLHPDPARGSIQVSKPNIAVEVKDAAGNKAFLWFLFHVQSTC